MTLELISEVLAATAGAHSARVLVRALATTLAARLPITRVELDSPAPRCGAELTHGEWRSLERFEPAAGTRVLADGIAVVTRGELPAPCTDPAFRAALAQVIAAAAGYIEVIERVAALSRRAHGESRELRADLVRQAERGAIVARSAAMSAVLSRVELVARHPTTVLLTGESGTGKEVIARAIHRGSPRAHRPLLQINCGAIPEALIESELFGHERGAFTGAERAHVGVFERAHRGTLVLDEVGELPPAAQVKLLRVLQERQVRRVGGEVQIDVDVRVIAATHRPLATLVETGAFRADLYYRLAVFTLALPPLRERAADLGPLVTALVQELSATLATPAPALTRAVLARLAAHSWPGNVRELRNVLETALILGGGDTLALPADFAAARPPRAESFESAARTAIEDALRACRGKLYGPGGAAERLGLKPGTLQSKMRKLGIPRLPPGTV